MGTHCSSELSRGHIKVKNTAIMKLILLTALAAVALAEPEADAHYGYGGYYGHGLYGYGYGHQLGWPTYSAPGFTSTVWGARGKRSAEEAAPAEDDKVYGTGHNSYVGQTIWGFPKVKRSAEEVEAVAEEAAAPAAHVAVAHPYFGYYGHQLGWPLFRAPGFSSQCFGCRGKRSADPEPYYGYYGYYGHGYAGNPTLATSFVGRSPQGLRGKRSAEAEPGYGYYGYPAYRGYYGYPYGLGVAGHPTGTSYSHRSPQGLGK